MRGIFSTRVASCDWTITPKFNCSARPLACHRRYVHRHIRLWSSRGDDLIQDNFVPIRGGLRFRATFRLGGLRVPFYTWVHLGSQSSSTFAGWPGIYG